MNRKLFNLARANAGRGSGIRSESAGDTATLYIYDIIDAFWGVSAQDVATALKAISAPKIDLRINTPGGDVFEARAIMTQLVAHPAEITAKIDGVAASAGSVIALAASTVQIADGGFYMIHKGWTWMMGNADDLRSTAALLDKIDGSLVNDYAAKTGKGAEEILSLMTAETWFTAEEAIEAGFCDSAMPTTAAAKAQARTFALGVYDNAPSALTEPEQQPDWDAAAARRLARARLYERSAA